ncbi:hypothetical protein LPJ53_004114 [Coemansia erecta]|uniref:THO complex subunit 1 transcription elongation factor-domain-containing protein n=1 Tax=Coemansia erecta TaxID=147472 RepID=A0A9W8CRA6_9FUNG|nr:hypothetical protein LPJ53_004114 [Coemansia erecta]
MASESRVDYLRTLATKAVDTAIELRLAQTDPLDASVVSVAAAPLVAELSDSDAQHQRDVEYALHTYVLSLVQQPGDEWYPCLLALTDIIAVLSDTGVVDSSLAFTLLEEALDALTIGQAARVFGHIERRAHTLCRGVSATGGKGIVMLRMCNALLRRIPQASMAELAGRVQLFVANSFALSERSGVNLRGDSDTTHVARADADEGDALYQAFWLLQRYFADPQMLTTGEATTKFVDALRRTQEEFRSSSGNNGGRPAAAVTLVPQGTETLRHLTAPALLRMQLADGAVKCQVLVQVIVFLRHVLALSGAALEKLRETATNKLVVAGFALEDSELAQLNDLHRRANKQLLSATNDRGLFSRTVHFVMLNDARWLRWKAESCRPFEPSAPVDAALVDEMQRAARCFLDHERVDFAPMRRHPVGNGVAGVASWELPMASAEDVDGLGCDVLGFGLHAAMRRLDMYCRDDGDYELLTASEQMRADLCHWRALREAVHADMFRTVDPASRALTSLRPSAELAPADAMDVELK